VNLKTDWDQTLEALRRRINRDEFEHWVQPLVPVSVSADTLKIAVPNRMFASWIEENYLDHVAAAWTEATGRKLEVTLTWDDAGTQGELFADLPRREKTPANRPSTTRSSSGLLGRYDFTSFIVGANNQFARAAAMAVAGQPGSLYNPLFLYGGVGLGKTHLANAIGNAVLDENPDARVLFLSAENFTNQLIDSIARNKTQAFKNRMRRVDLLIIDDVQFLAGRERTQDEFFHVFNALYERGRQIVLTSDKFPNELHGVEERLCNRFGWGLVADIQAPEVETRIAILERKARDEGIEVPFEVSQLIANRIDSNVRDLEGALTRISAFASLNGRSITMELAEQMLTGVAPGSARTVTLDDIQRGVAQHFGLQAQDLIARRRTKKIAEARQVAMYIMRNHVGASYPAIGQHLGGRDHSTVIHACQSVERRRKTDPRFRHMIETVTRLLGGSQQFLAS
jgi:chromosomal replication initiator protein